MNESEPAQLKSSGVSATLLYTLLLFVAHPLAQWLQPNITENEGAKEAGTLAVTVV